MKKKLSIVLCAVLALCMLFSACGNGGGGNKSNNQSASGSNPAASTPDKPEPSGGMDIVESTGDTTFDRKTEEGSFVYGSPEEPESLDPTVNKLVAGWSISSCVYDNILKMDADTGEIECVAAESYEFLDDGTLVVKLRDGLTFSNGTKATSDDILFTLERLAVSSRFSTNYECVDFEKTTCPDDKTIEIRFKYTYAPFMAYFCHPAAALMSRAYFEEVGEDEFGRKPIGTGAYIFESWNAGDRIVLKRNENYWGEKPEVETIVMRFILEATTRFIEFETGGVDAVGDLSSNDIDRMKNGEIGNATLYTCRGENVSVLEMFKGYEPLANKDVRLAIGHAVDWEALVETVYGNAGFMADSIVPPDCLYYKSIGVYEYDPELSKQLLADAGYASGLTLTTYVYAGTEEEACEIIQSYLKDVGVNMEIEIVDVGTMIGKQVSGECNFGLSNSTCTARDPDQAISSSKMSSDYGIARINDQTLQDMYDAGSVETDAAKRQKIYEDMAQYYFDECIRIPVRVNVVSYAVRDYVDYFPAHSSNIIDFASITFKK